MKSIIVNFKMHVDFYLKQIIESAITVLGDIVELV